MGMTFSARYFVIASLICGTPICRTAVAQDISGRWSGVADTTDEGNTKRQEPQSFEVKTVDGKLTAVSIGKDGKPGAALKIEQDGAKVNLYRFLDFEGGEHLRWKVEPQRRQARGDVLSIARRSEKMGLRPHRRDNPFEGGSRCAE